MALIANAINVTDSKITDVTVFRNYAKETRLANLTLPEGNSEIIISNVSTFMDENTLQVATKGNVKTLSVSIVQTDGDKSTLLMPRTCSDFW